MRIKSHLLLLLVLACLASCTQKNNKFAIKATIANMPEQTAYLSELGIDKIVLVDSATTDKSGEFKMTGTAPEPGLYRISFSSSQNKNVLLSIDKGNTITILGDWNTIEQSKITGSPSTESLNRLIFTIRDHMRDFNTMGVVMDSFKAKGNDSMLAIAERDLKEMNYQLTQYVEQYADTTNSLPNALFAAQLLNPQTEMGYYKTFVPGLEKRFPGAKLAKDFTAKMNTMMGGGAQQQQAPGASGPVAGTNAPEINMQDVNGKQVSLASMRGKYVLVDFWASWCGPCRKENPNVVAAFNKFKSKNFTILGVSLDEDKEKWMQAITKDGLAWAHISDLQGWQSAAARDYGINSIPANFLIDPQGKIIARDLRGPDLENALTELIK